MLPAFGLVIESIVCKVDRNNTIDMNTLSELSVGDETVIRGTIQGIGFTDIEVNPCMPFVVVIEEAKTP